MTWNSFINRFKFIRQLYLVICNVYSFIIYDVYFKKKQNNQKAFQFLERDKNYA